MDVTVMIIIWSIVVATALLIEFLTYDMVSMWFAAGGIVALITAPCGLWWPWQILVFVAVSLVCLLSLRRVCLKFIKGKTIPTNLDANVGKKVKILKDVKDGRSEIKINDITWTVACSADLKEGATVEITGMEGNKYIVTEVN